MSDEPLRFCFGVHNHQPFGNFDHVVAEATARAYQPFLERLRDRPEVRLTMHWTGSLLEWLRERAPVTFDLLGTIVARGQVELLTGGFYEPILAVIPDRDKRGQIERLTGFLGTHFGVRARGMWLAERVWEPHLPRALREAGVEYVLVDDTHFGLAGLDPDELGGYYLTEEQGATLAVFPISQPLRYLIPFGTVEETIQHLAERRGRVPALTMVDDGEKFGAWPGTFAHVYGAGDGTDATPGWLDRFFDALLAAPDLLLTTFAEVIDTVPALGRVYLPTASYREMGEWALPTTSGRRLAAAKSRLGALEDTEGIAGLLRGGFWRAFLMKYPEVADTYWKMLRLSGALETERARRPADDLRGAQIALWQGQANDAFWHGVFGGCYLPHLRRAVKGALLDAEHRLRPPAPIAWERGDGNGDGRDEIYVRTAELAVTINPALGGALTELGYFPCRLDLADVLARRPEPYHDRVRPDAIDGPITVGGSGSGSDRAIPLAYDEVRRASLLDGLLTADGFIDPVSPWRPGDLILADQRWRYTATAVGDDALAVSMTRDSDSVHTPTVAKEVTVRGAAVIARYRLLPAAGHPLMGRWAVQLNLALTAGQAPGRYFTLPGRPSLGSAGRVADVSAVALVDEWIGVEARLQWTPGAELAWGPVETVSVSEAGLERIYQGTALLLVWPLGHDDVAHPEFGVELSVRGR